MTTERWFPVTYNGMQLEVTGDWDPGERPVYYYKDGSGHPGTPPSYAVTGVRLAGGGQDVTPLLSDEVKDELADLAYPDVCEAMDQDEDAEQAARDEREKDYD